MVHAPLALLARGAATLAASALLVGGVALAPASADVVPNTPTPAVSSVEGVSDPAASAQMGVKDWGHHKRHHHHHMRHHRRHVFLGRVVARRGLNVRFGPTTHSHVVRVLRRGTVIKISCKVVSQRIKGNRLWYKLARTHGQWVSARYVKNIGRAPRFC